MPASIAVRYRLLPAAAFAKLVHAQGGVGIDAVELDGGVERPREGVRGR